MLFVHGWNKNPSLAEHDFSDFLCRLHGHIREVAKERGMWGESQKGQRLLVIGAFWPSTFRANAHDPFWLKPSSYFRMRDRADTIADTGLQELLMTVALGLRSRANLHFVGHSFGARMIVHGLRHISAAGRLPELISRAGIVNVVLLNGALPSHDFTWLLENVGEQRPARPLASRSRPLPACTTSIPFTTRRIGTCSRSPPSSAPMRRNVRRAHAEFRVE